MQMVSSRFRGSPTLEPVSEFNRGGRIGLVPGEEVSLMPLRPLNREQALLLPPTLGELIPDDHPALRGGVC